MLTRKQEFTLYTCERCGCTSPSQTFIERCEKEHCCENTTISAKIDIREPDNPLLIVFCKECDQAKEVYGLNALSVECLRDIADLIKDKLAR